MYPIVNSSEIEALDWPSETHLYKVGKTMSCLPRMTENGLYIYTNIWFSSTSVQTMTNLNHRSWGWCSTYIYIYHIYLWWWLGGGKHGIVLPTFYHDNLAKGLCARWAPGRGARKGPAGDSAIHGTRALKQDRSRQGCLKHPTKYIVTIVVNDFSINLR